MKLVEISSGKCARVLGFYGSRGLEFKMLQLGLRLGDKICVLRHAPLGGPFLIETNGRVMALGRRIASRIIVEEIKCDLSS